MGRLIWGWPTPDLDLGNSRAAVRESQLAEKAMGDSQLVHVVRATAYGREGMLTKAVDEYRAALKFTPNDGSLHLGLGNALFAERRYHDAVNELLIAQKFIPARTRWFTRCSLGRMPTYGIESKLSDMFS